MCIQQSKDSNWSEKNTFGCIKSENGRMFRLESECLTQSPEEHTGTHT